MATPEFFTVTADYKSIIADSSSDSDYLGELGPISATVTFTPLLQSGDVLLATTATPRPTGYVPVPVVGRIDVETGRLMLRVDPDDGGTGTFAPVTLMANTELLEIDGPLYYRVTFSEVVIGGRPGYLAPFDFEAPTTGGVDVNLIEVAPVPGSIANGIVKVSPGGVRQIDGTTIAFTFGGVDLQPTVSLAALTGPAGPTGATGAAGAAATISVGSVTSLPPGSTPTVVNDGSSSAAVLSFGLVTGATGATGATGDAATISVGSVTALPPGSTPTVVNEGSSGAAVLAFGLVTGDTGATGATGATGPQGDPGQAATISVGTVTSGETASVTNGGDTTEAVLDFVLPVGPAGPQGDPGQAATIAVDSTVTGDPGTDAAVENLGDTTSALLRFTVPRGLVGATGSQGPQGDPGQAATISIGTVTTGDPGTAASAVNVGTDTAAVIDLVIPKGDTGSASSETWETLAGKPAVIAAGATKADARAAIDAAALDASGFVAADQLPSVDWSTLSGKPAVIAAGATEADARAAIDAEYTGNKGASGGYASLDENGLVPQAQLPITTASWSTLDGKPAVVAAGATKSDARSAIDAEYTGAKGQPNGYASLDASGRVPLAQLTLTAVDGGTPSTAAFVDSLDGGTP